MPLDWNIHYAGWMIDDGLPGRRVGESFDWEVEFWSKNLTRTTEQIKSATPLPDYGYRIVGELFHVSEQACLLDFGLKVFGERTQVPAKCKQGDYVAGNIGLGFLHGRLYPPEITFEALNRNWHVNSIQADMTPYISNPDNPKYFFRDESRIHYESVLFTTRYKVHDYILQCSVSPTVQ